MAPTNYNRRPNKNDARAQRSQRTRQQKKPKRHFGCGICQADHSLSNCRKFNNMNLADKYQTAVKLHYCVNCLARNHLIAKCNSKARCSKCSGKHHTLLHGPARLVNDLATEESPSTPTTSAAPPIPAPRTLSSQTTTIIQTSRTKTFVPTIMVQVVMDKGNKMTRAVLNPSLTRSKIASSFVRDSWLKAFNVDNDIYVKVLIAPNVVSNLRYEICMEVVKDLPKLPYPNAMDEGIKDKVCRISLADPEFYSNTPIAMEIGGDLYTTIIQPNTINIDGGSLVAQDSTLGWLIMGSLTH